VAQQTQVERRGVLSQGMNHPSPTGRGLHQYLPCCSFSPVLTTRTCYSTFHSLWLMEATHSWGLVTFILWARLGVLVHQCCV
jgi:hypothetical protein